MRLPQKKIHQENICPDSGPLRFALCPGRRRSSRGKVPQIGYKGVGVGPTREKRGGISPWGLPNLGYIEGKKDFY